jgi:hypothetical protein
LDPGYHKSIITKVLFIDSGHITPEYPVHSWFPYWQQNKPAMVMANRQAEILNRIQDEAQLI